MTHATGAVKVVGRQIVVTEKRGHRPLVKDDVKKDPGKAKPHAVDEDEKQPTATLVASRMMSMKKGKHHSPGGDDACGISAWLAVCRVLNVAAFVLFAIMIMAFGKVAHGDLLGCRGRHICKEIACLFFFSRHGECGETMIKSMRNSVHVITGLFSQIGKSSIDACGMSNLESDEFAVHVEQFVGIHIVIDGVWRLVASVSGGSRTCFTGVFSSIGRLIATLVRGLCFTPARTGGLHKNSDQDPCQPKPD